MNAPSATRRRIVLGAAALTQTGLPTLLHARTPSHLPMMIDRTTAPSTTVSGSARLRTYATPDRGKTPIVFLHASVCDSRMWHHEIATLGPTRRIAAFDRRGFGETKAVHETFANVDDTIAVMDVLKIDRAVLVGCSNGGRVALDTYFAHPDRVAGMVLVCGAIGGTPEEETEWVNNPQMAAMYACYLEAEKANDSNTLAKITAHVWLDGPHEREGRVGGAVRELFMDMVAKSLVGSQDEDKGFVSESAYANLENVKAPTLIVWGPLDVRDVTRTMKHAAVTIPGAQSLEVPGTAHLPNLERPDLFTPRLTRLVESLD